MDDEGGFIKERITLIAVPTGSEVSLAFQDSTCTCTKRQ
jgi:hypothetical protein